MMEEKEKLISAKEAAKRLGISRASLSRFVRAKRIGVHRLGGRIMFSDEILESFKAATFHPPDDEKIPL